VTETKTHHGQCHCGAVRFELDSALDSPGDCNCSRCRRLGVVWQSVPAQNFRLEAGEGAQTLYRFNTERIEHLFCSRCGIESFARGADGKGNAVVMVNVNCLDDAPSPDRAAITHWDGRSW
jgi:hypothetical protein